MSNEEECAIPEQPTGVESAKLVFEQMCGEWEKRWREYTKEILGALVTLDVPPTRIYEWHDYKRELWANQKLPTVHRSVLVRIFTNAPGCEHRPAIAVGYLKLGAGDKDSPYFVVPSVVGTVVAWCDCLPEPISEPRGLWIYP